MRADLHAANVLDRDGRMWTYLAYGPFATLKPNTASGWSHGGTARSAVPCHRRCARRVAPRDSARTCVSILRKASIEVGHLAFSPLLQRTPAATEAMYLMMRHAFELGYRRYEWKCNALNAPSCRAAERLGFTFEGIFRQATISKGRNRDTAWYSIIDREWPAIRAAFEDWLDPSNFDADGRQREPLQMPATGADAPA